MTESGGLCESEALTLLLIFEKILLETESLRLGFQVAPTDQLFPRGWTCHIKIETLRLDIQIESYKFDFHVQKIANSDLMTPLKPSLKASI